jgi:hypothetical protein
VELLAAVFGHGSELVTRHVHQTEWIRGLETRSSGRTLT